VYEPPRLVATYPFRGVVFAGHETVCGFSPFEDYIGALIAVRKNEASIEKDALGILYTGNNRDSGCTKALHTAARNCGKGIQAPDHD
jgi:hypothetical protein